MVLSWLHRLLNWKPGPAARQGGTVVVFVHGRSGAGKSLLVQRFLEDLACGAEAVVLGRLPE